MTVTGTNQARNDAGPPSIRPVSHLRWWIGGMLLASTIINYIDRQTLSALAPFLKQEYHWSNTDYAHIVIAFRVSYSIGLTLCGRLLDRIGTRRGLSLSVLWYSLVAAATSLASGFYSFMTFRFLLGAGESANWPGATKAVSEWFPKRERALATALFDSGSSVGGAVAPFIVLAVYSRWGWRPAFVIPGVLGVIWLLAWRRVYQPPEQHPRVGAGELRMILVDREDEAGRPFLRPKWRDLLKLPQTWGAIAAKGTTDPVWFFITDWFPIYLVAKGISIRSGLLAVWVPFIASDVGNFFAGAASGYLVKRGWPLGRARKTLVVLGGIGVLLLIPTIFTDNLWTLIGLFAIATFSYSCFSTMANVLPADLFESGSVASVSGMSGTAAGIGTIVAFQVVGSLTDARRAMGTHSFDPIMVVAGLIPFFGMILVLLLVRNTKATDDGLVRRV